MPMEWEPFPTGSPETLELEMDFVPPSHPRGTAGLSFSVGAVAAVQTPRKAWLCMAPRSVVGANLCLPEFHGKA